MLTISIPGCEVTYPNKLSVRSDVILRKESVFSDVTFNEKEAYLLFSRLLMVCSCKKVATQRSDLASIIRMLNEFEPLGTLNVEQRSESASAVGIFFVALITSTPDLSFDNVKDLSAMLC